MWPNQTTETKKLYGWLDDLSVLHPSDIQQPGCTSDKRDEEEEEEEKEENRLWKLQYYRYVNNGYLSLGVHLVEQAIPHFFKRFQF